MLTHPKVDRRQNHSIGIILTIQTKPYRDVDPNRD